MDKHSDQIGSFVRGTWVWKTKSLSNSL